MYIGDERECPTAVLARKALRLLELLYAYHEEASNPLRVGRVGRPRPS